MHIEFLPISEATALVARDPQTVRRWASRGQVRRRQRGRIIEYHKDDLLEAAGLTGLDAKDREIARLRVELEQVRAAHQEAEEKAARRKRSNVGLRNQAAARYAEKDQMIADLARANQALVEVQAVEREQKQAARQQVETYLVGLEQRARAREVDIARLTTENARLTAVAAHWKEAYQDVWALLGAFDALVDRLLARLGLLSKGEDRQEQKRLREVAGQLNAQMRRWLDQGR